MSAELVEGSMANRGGGRRRGGLRNQRRARASSARHLSKTRSMPTDTRIGRAALARAGN